MNESSQIPSYGVSLNTTQVVDDVNLTTSVQEVPQIQTTVTENGPEVVSIVNAPFVQVTSVNGKTGDVTVDAKVEQFKTNKQYSEGSLCVNSGSLYIARRSFTSGTSFNSNDWIQVQGGGGGGASVQSDWKASNTSDPAYIKNKPTNLKQIDNSYIPFTQDEKTKLQTLESITAQNKAKLALLDQPYTQAEKTKLAGIETGAQRNVPQVQADWQQSNSSQPSFIKNKPNNLVTDSRYVHTDNNFTNEIKDRVLEDYLKNETKSVKVENIDFTDIPTYKYKDTEMDTGKKWIDGRPIFRKVVRGKVNFTGNSSSSIPHGITGLTGAWEIISYSGCMRLGGTLSDELGKQTLPYIESTHQAGVSTITESNVNINGSYPWGWSEISVVVEYVK